MHRSLLLTIAVSTFAVPLAHAQSGSDLRPGDEVRVQAESFAGRFTVVDVGADSIALQGDARYAPIRVPVASIRSLAVYRGQRSRLAGALHRGTWGLAIGGLAGGMMGLAAGSDPPETQWFAMTAGEKAGILGLTFGLVGGFAGGIIGAAAPGQQWEQIGIRALLSVAPASGGGLAVGLTHRF